MLQHHKIVTDRQSLSIQAAWASLAVGLIQDRRCAYKRNNEARSRNHCCHGEAISIKYYECMFVDVVIQHALRMSRILSSSLLRLYRIFRHFINGTNFGEKNNGHTNVCDFSLQLLSYAFYFKKD